jgi:hypothetical protein
VKQERQNFASIVLKKFTLKQKFVDIVEKKQKNIINQIDEKIEIDSKIKRRS